MMNYVGLVGEFCFLKGPLTNYVILLGGGGDVTKRFYKITRGEGGIHHKITLDYKVRGVVNLVQL